MSRKDASLADRRGRPSEEEAAAAAAASEGAAAEAEAGPAGAVAARIIDGKNLEVLSGKSTGSR